MRQTPISIPVIRCDGEGNLMVMVASRFLRYIPEAPMRGPDVREVQERLRRFGYYLGALDSIFGRGTHDAVIAFQATRQLTPDGVVGPMTYSALGTDPTPQTLGSKGPMITIDLERRRLYFSRGGVIQRSYDVAVGSPQTPTPVGRWVVVQKTLNPGGPFGTRWMRMNIPWGGYGIHGTDAPTSIGKAVSHGCIRLGQRDVEDLYSRVPIGTTVNIVGSILTGRVLFPGMEAPEVRTVQDILSILGFYRGPINGIYGPQTVDSVRQFQLARGLPADGIVGPVTYDALVEALDEQLGNTEP